MAARSSYLVLVCLLSFALACQSSPFRKLPGDKKQQSIPFAAHLAIDSSILAHKSGQVTIDITATQSAAEDLKYVLKSWQVTRIPRRASDHLQGKLCLRADQAVEISPNYELSFGAYVLYYVPCLDPAGEYGLKLVIENSKGDQREVHQKFRVHEVDYTIIPKTDPEGTPRIAITAPEAQEKDRWVILEERWSKGVEGNLGSKALVADKENELAVSLGPLDYSALDEQPCVEVKIKGPDDKEQTVKLGLGKVCLKKILADLEAQKRALQEKTQAIKEALANELGDDVRAKRAQSRAVQRLLDNSGLVEKQAKEVLSGAEKLARSPEAGIAFKQALLEVQGLYEDLGRQISSAKSHIHVVFNARGVSSTAEGLFKALNQGNKAMIEAALADPDLDVDLVDEAGTRLLDKAVEKGALVAVKGLVELGADIEAENEDSLTPLTSAIAKGHLGIVKYFIEEKGIDVNAQDSGGYTPLEIAINEDQKAIERYLRARGAKEEE